MIEKLRYKFIYTAMASVFVVMVVILMALNIVNYSSTNTRADEVLAVLAENKGVFPDIESSIVRDGPPRNFTRVMNLNPEAPFETRYFKVLVASDGNVQQIDTSRIWSIDSETAQIYAEEVFENNQEWGYVNDFRFWKVEQADGGFLLLFVDNFRELASFRNFLYSSIIIGLFSLVMIFILVVISSKKIVAPVQENLDRQKQFITDAGHEIRTPLSIISANNDVQELLEGQTEWTDSTRKQIVRLNGLIDDMLGLARINEGTYQQAVQSVDLSQLTETASEPFKLLNKQNGVTFLLATQADLIVKADSKALEKVWSILLDNATKYVSQSGTIEISLYKDKKKAVLMVANTVTEMPADLNRIFDRFYRESESRNQRTGGYGIGLSLAQAIVEQHEGEITATGKTGEPLQIKFIVRLPLHA